MTFATSFEISFASQRPMTKNQYCGNNVQAVFRKISIYLFQYVFHGNLPLFVLQNVMQIVPTACFYGHDCTSA